jgi:L-asparaginase II
VTRCGIVEEISRGVVCCVKSLPQRNWEIIYSEGNADKIIYPRSALKFVQVLPLLESGAIEFFDFSEDEIAVMCSSHFGQPVHIEAVKSILSKIVSNYPLFCLTLRMNFNSSLQQFL